MLRHVPPDLFFIPYCSMPADYLRDGEHICLVLHADNTEAEIDEFIGRIERWATRTEHVEEAEAANIGKRKPQMLQARL